jgi:two-component system, NtrC family, response regulator GlrR
VSSPARLVLVDDEPDILRALADYLASTLPHADIVAVSGADAALRELELAPADVLVTDFKMPGMDGLQLVRAVHRRWPRTATVLLTAFPDVQLAIAAVNEGRVRHFLTKPVEPATLRDVVRGLLDERQAEALRGEALRRAAALGPGPDR